MMPPPVCDHAPSLKTHYKKQIALTTGFVVYKALLRIMDIHSAKASEIGELANFYRITGYGGSVAPADRVVYATEEERIIGAGRLSDEEGGLVLRGIRVLKEHRGRGVGSAILDTLVSRVSNRDCYCIPYSNLRTFYAAKGFEEIKPLEAPSFICNRFRDYRDRGLDVILMRKKPIG